MNRRCIGWLVAAGIAGLAALARGDPLTDEEAARFRDLDSRPLHTFTNVDLADYLQLRAKAIPGEPIPARIELFARKSLRQPYRLNAAMHDLSESDCVTFVEHTVAVACASDWTSYYRILHRLRFKEDAKTFLDTNHFTLQDWVPNNAWLLRDLTDELGTSATFTSVAWRKAFFKGITLDEGWVRGGVTPQVLADRIASEPIKQSVDVAYTPHEAVASILDKLQTGDIALIIRRYEKPGLKPWLDCDHIAILQVTDGQSAMVFGSPPRARSESLLAFLAHYKHVAGFKFLRLRDNARQLVADEMKRLVGTVGAPDAAAVDDSVQRLRALRARPIAGGIAVP